MLRNCREEEIAAESLVPGDLIVVRAGDKETLRARRAQVISLLKEIGSFGIPERRNLKAAFFSLLPGHDRFYLRRALVGTAGKFGERWVELAQAYGAEVITVESPYGQCVSIEQMKKRLETQGPFRAVLIQATESSTGVRHDVEALGKLVRGYPETCLVVDAITGLGTMPLDIPHEYEGQWVTHKRAHNVYGFNMARACHEALRTLKPNERPFVITRAAFY